MAAEGTSCVTLPPVTVADYTPKGSYSEIVNLKTYTTSTPSPSRGIIFIYDVFGFAPQTIQGADRLSLAANAVVVAPGPLGDNTMKAEWVPADTEEKKAAQAKFRETLWEDRHLANVKLAAEAAKRAHPEVTKWGIVGLCWGGKQAVLASIGDQSLFQASGQAHPAKLTREDAEAFKIPHICLASAEEPVDAVAAYKEVLVGEGKPNVVETYSTSHHGWMGARARLGEEGNLKEYERGYAELAAFFEKHL